MAIPVEEVLDEEEKENTIGLPEEVEWLHRNARDGAVTWINDSTGQVWGDESSDKGFKEKYDQKAGGKRGEQVTR